MHDQNANSQASTPGCPLRPGNVLVDGLSITDLNDHAVFVPSSETVQEVKLQASTCDAGSALFCSLIRAADRVEFEWLEELEYESLATDVPWIWHAETKST
jgi:hypothetical protein